MSKNEGGPAPDPGDSSGQMKDGQAGIAGGAAKQGGEPSPGGSGRDEASSADDRAIDLDSAHHRAS
ncbi:MAG TPA: hypothetical protein VE891_08930 [Allosphingosinicella sp.]|nr:hypothetical protein [Allosphingosinicella sp.]